MMHCSFNWLQSVDCVYLARDPPLLFSKYSSPRISHRTLFIRNHTVTNIYYTMFNFRNLFLAGLALVGTSTASSSFVQDLTPSNFDDIVLKSGKPSLVEFFAPWCGHCKTLAPIYEELAGVFNSASAKVIVAKVDADQHKSLGQRFGVKGFPTLKWFDGKSETPIDYTGGRDLESLSKWITDKTGVKAKVKKVAPSAVKFLTDKTFKELIGSDKDVLVAFTTPWCGRKFILPLFHSPKKFLALIS